MKRKLLSALLAAVMVVTAIPSALAAKKVYEEEVVAGQNLYSWGTFDSEEEVAMAKTYMASNSYHIDGLDDGCIKTTVNGQYGGLRIPAPLVVGETYDISFDMKADAEAKMQLIFYYTGAAHLTIEKNNAFKTEWTHFTLTWTNTGVDSKGVQTAGAGEFDVRFGDGLTMATYYIDNFSVVARGNMPDADYSSLKMVGSSSTKTEVKKEENNTPVDVTEVTFSDMENHWAKDTVNTLATYGYVEGMGNNQYSPNSNVTRAQFVKMFVDATYDVTAPDYDGAFSDVKGDEWFAPYVTIANKLGMLDTAMTIGGTFKPDQAITREEAASIAVKAAVAKNATKTGGTSAFGDDADISVWAKSAVSDAAAYGLIEGYEDGTYKPQANITRAEAAQILKRVAEFTTRFEIYVDADNGDDKNDGTKEAPLKTIYAARDLVRKYNATMTNNIKVLIKGRHYLNKTFELDAADSGMNGYRVVYTSWGDEKPELSMGDQFTDFKLHDEELNIYKVYVGKGFLTRQAYFNEVRGIRARSVAPLTNAEFIDNQYYTSEDTHLLEYEHPEDLEFVFHINWCNPRAVLESIKDLGNGRVKLTPLQSAWASVSVRVIKRPGEEVQLPSYYENAYELLDQEGEWYMNRHDGYMYYIPREGEDMSTMVMTVPTAEQMITATGESGKNPVRNITFDNIEFADTSWLRPTTVGGHSDSQNNHIRDANGVDTGMPGAAIKVTNGHYIDFTNNKFTRMGVTALWTSRSIQHCNIVGNEFFDISGTAVSLGGFDDPELPASEDQYNQYNKVNNNYIHHVAVEYGSAAAISAGYPRHTEINHNVISTLPYSGMHIGYGWARFAEKGTALYDVELGYNYIRENAVDRLYDGAGIYTLGASSLESANLKNRIVGNYFESMRNGYGAVYPDEGSTHWHIYNNVVDARDVDRWEFNYDKYYEESMVHWLHIWTGTIKYNIINDNYVTNSSARMDGEETDYQVAYEYPDADWPEEAQEVIENAGIEPEYRDNFDMDGAETLVANVRSYELGKNESKQLEIKINGQYGKEYPLSDYYVKYYSSDPSVLQVSEDGVMTAVGSGEVWVQVVALVDGKLQFKTIKVLAGDEFNSIGVNVTNLNMVEGYTAQLDVIGKTTFGRDVVVPKENVTFTSTNEDIVTVTAEGEVTAVGKGEASIILQASQDGIELNTEIPVKIITYSQEDSLDLPYVNAPSSMFVKGKWSGTTVVNGNSIAVTGSPAYFTGERITNKLIAFDLTINNPNSWPAFVFCAPDQMQNYKTSSCYMIAFKADHAELQRFNDGDRTAIFGNEAQYSPVGGPGVPNLPEDPIFEYGKTCSVIVGVLDTEEGTRIVLTINGENVFDYLDTDENRLTADGLFGIYNPGDFTFSPYTGMTNE